MKLSVESEHGFDFFIELTAHDIKTTVRLHKDDPSYWWLSSPNSDPALNQWVAAGKVGYPEALKRAFTIIEMYCAGADLRKRIA